MSLTPFPTQVITSARKALPYPLSKKAQSDGTALVGGMIHALKDLYTEGLPQHMSFTYTPNWRLIKLEGRIRELLAKGESFSGPGGIPGEEQLKELEELQRKAQVCRRGVQVSDMCEVKLAQGLGVLRDNVLSFDDLADLHEWHTLDGCVVHYTPTSRYELLVFVTCTENE